MQAAPEARPDAIGEADLARRMAAGDQGAFVPLMRRRNHAVPHRTARSILRDEAMRWAVLRDAATTIRRRCGANIVWNAQTLDAFLANPRPALPGTSMTYDGVPDRAERAALIAYLKAANGGAECR